MKKIRALSVNLSLTFGLLITVNLGQIGCGGKPFDKWVAGDENFKIVVKAYHEQYRYNAGTYYEFEFLKDRQTRLIMTFRHDDPNPIDRKSVVFVNDKVIYAYMGWKFVVTTDGGETWSTWDAENALAEWKCCNYYLIDSVILNENGMGKMQLRKTKNMPARTLVTSDYGKSWSSDSNRQISENLTCPT